MNNIERLPHGSLSFLALQYEDQTHLSATFMERVLGVFTKFHSLDFPGSKKL